MRRHQSTSSGPKKMRGSISPAAACAAGREELAGAEDVLDLARHVVAVVGHQVPADGRAVLEELPERRTAHERQEGRREAPGGELERSVLVDELRADEADVRMGIEVAHELGQGTGGQARVAVEEHAQPSARTPKPGVARRDADVGRQRDHLRLGERLDHRLRRAVVRGVVDEHHLGLHGRRMLGHGGQAREHLVAHVVGDDDDGDVRRLGAHDGANAARPTIRRACPRALRGRFGSTSRIIAR